MAINSINTNIAAYFAQQNIGNASGLAAASVARLSSGNRIVQASDDVTALAIGTALQTQLSAIRTAQTNAAQGSSLLQVADGAVAQIIAILQQQQSIANQSQSGSLTDTNRGFLQTQFAKLTAQIDAIANGTTFNGVSLIDGSLATGGGGASSIRSANIGAATAAAVVTGTTPGTDVLGFSSFKNTAAADNDIAFVGDLSKGIWGVSDSGVANTFIISFAINSQTYQGQWVAGTDADVDLVSTDGKATLVLDMNASSTLDPAAASYADVNDLKDQLETFFSDATAYAIHKVATTFAKDANNNDIAGSAIRLLDTAGGVLDGFSGTNVKIQSALFSGASLPAISTFSAVNFGTNTIFSVLVNGVKYSQDSSIATYGAGATTLALFQNVGPTATGGTVALGTAGHLYLFKNGDSFSKEYIDITFTGVISNALRVDTAANVQKVADALNTAFSGSATGGSGGLNFQLGTTSDSIINVTLASARASALFNGASLDVSTAGGAATAATAVTSAINLATASRATIGAYEQQVGFATATLQSSAQNVAAAASAQLDTDIALESTAYATNQVKLQAGISVLAQANQQLQALLKLIG